MLNAHRVFFLLAFHLCNELHNPPVFILVALLAIISVHAEHFTEKLALGTAFVT